jgi:hypothetical protein
LPSELSGIEWSQLTSSTHDSKARQNFQDGLANCRNIKNAGTDASWKINNALGSKGAIANQRGQL